MSTASNLRFVQATNSVMRGLKKASIRSLVFSSATSLVSPHTAKAQITTPDVVGPRHRRVYVPVVKQIPIYERACKSVQSAST
jgi:hypothetical protein